MINVYINEPGLEDYTLHTYRADEFRVSTDTGYLTVLNDSNAVAVYPPGSWHHVHQPDSEAPAPTSDNKDTTQVSLEGDGTVPWEEIKRLSTMIPDHQITVTKINSNPSRKPGWSM